MRIIIRFFVALSVFMVCVFIGYSLEEDIAGSKDHPLLSRMNNYYISGYKEEAYDSHAFYDEEDNEYVIEGRKWVIEYTLQEGYPAPGQLKVFRNHINAIQKIGGEILYERGLTMKASEGDKEIWIEVWATDDGSDYRLTIVERTLMEQEVVADPEAMAKDIDRTGHVAVYGIYFDFDSYTIKPESETALNSIAELLNNNPRLEVYIVGHTDMTGTLDHNMHLSTKRAESVVKELINSYRISAARLQAMGVGPLSPKATNRTEEGRKINRRVELVEKN